MPAITANTTATKEKCPISTPMLNRDNAKGMCPAGKPAAIMGASTGRIGTARAQYHLRQVFVFLNVYPINQPEVMIGNAAERFDAQGNLRDETSKNLIRQLLQNLVDWAERLRRPQDLRFAPAGALPLPPSYVDGAPAHA